MLVICLKNVPASLKGALSRYLIEPETGVFLGSPSARVRDELWKMVLKRAGAGSALMIWSTACPQGYEYRQYHTEDRKLVDYEGLALVRVKRRRRRQATAEGTAEGGVIEEKARDGTEYDGIPT